MYCLHDTSFCTANSNDGAQIDQVKTMRIIEMCSVDDTVNWPSFGQVLRMICFLKQTKNDFFINKSLNIELKVA